MFIRLCTTSKCNNLTYNASLYTRGNIPQTRGEEETGREKEEKEKRTEQKRDRAWMYALRKSYAKQSIVPNGTIVLHNNTLHNTKKDTILYNDTLSDTKKDSFLVSIDRNRGNSKKRKLEYVNWKRMSIIGTGIRLDFYILQQDVLESTI